VRVAAWLELDRDVEGLRYVLRFFAAQPVEPGDDLGELIRVLDADGEEALISDRPAQRL
jgi:hypothetical protein